MQATDTGMQHLINVRNNAIDEVSQASQTVQRIITELQAALEVEQRARTALSQAEVDLRDAHAKAAEAAAAAIAKQKAEEAAAIAKQKAEEEAAAIAKQKVEEEAAAIAKQKAEEEAAAIAKQKAEEEAAAIAKQKAEEEAAAIAKQKAEEEAAAIAKQKAEEEEEAIAKQKAEEEEAAIAKQKAEASSAIVTVAGMIAKQKTAAEEEAEEEAAAIAKQQAEDEEDEAKRIERYGSWFSLAKPAHEGLVRGFESCGRNSKRINRDNWVIVCSLGTSYDDWATCGKIQPEDSAVKVPIQFRAMCAEQASWKSRDRCHELKPNSSKHFLHPTMCGFITRRMDVFEPYEGSQCNARYWMGPSGGVWAGVTKNALMLVYLSHRPDNLDGLKDAEALQDYLVDAGY